MIVDLFSLKGLTGLTKMLVLSTMLHRRGGLEVSGMWAGRSNGQPQPLPDGSSPSGGQSPPWHTMGWDHLCRFSTSIWPQISPHYIFCSGRWSSMGPL